MFDGELIIPGQPIGGHVFLDVNWSLLAAGSSEVIRRGEQSIQVQGAAGDSDAIASTMSRALAQLADRFVDGLS